MRRAAILVLALLGATCRAQMLERQWARLATNCSSYSVAPDGAVVLSCDWDGHVQCLDAAGRVRWRAQFARAVHAVCSGNAALTVAYSEDDTAYRHIHFLDGSGRPIRTETAPGAVRSVAVSEDGRVVAILSEPARITLLERTARGWRWRRRALAGPVASLSMDAEGHHIAVSLRQPEEVAALDRSLRIRWRWRGDVATRYRVQMDRSGKAIVAAAIPREGIARAILWNTESSRPVWSHTLRGDLARVMMAPDGGAVAAAYRTRIWHRHKSAVEARVALFSRGGRMQWEVGGLMFGAHLVGVAPEPRLLITHDGNRVLAALDSYGHMRARDRLPAGIQSTSVSADGTHFAVRTDAGILYYLRARR